MRVFWNEYFKSLRVPPGCPRASGWVKVAPRGPSRIRVVDGQVGQVRLG